MEIRDVIHGSVVLSPQELPVVDSRYFQRLRHIKQLGFAENSFPSATHNRYIHSLGAMETATQVFDQIFHSPQGGQPSPLSYSAFQRFRATIRMAALLHDIGHGPLSHTSEFAMPEISKLGLKALKTKPRKATHEDYTLKMILDSGLTALIEGAGKRYDFKPAHVASLIEPRLEVGDDFFIEPVAGTHPQSGEKINFRPLLRQLISSEIDADRMDYLRRDSLHAGVSYGQFDYEWLLGNLTYHFERGNCYLALQHRSLYTLEDFLLSRYHMFLMIYFHYKSVIYDEMLGRYFSSPDCDYFLPSDIEKYCEYNDAHLYAHLSQSDNEWARRIIERKPYRILIELHSGIPAGRAAKVEQQALMSQILDKLTSRKIHHLTVTSTSELSKYFQRPGDPIYVRYDDHYSPPSFIPLEQCTEIFERYREKRSITRLYVSPEDYDLCKEDVGPRFISPSMSST